jgi:hypothetical protein
MNFKLKLWHIFTGASIIFIAAMTGIILMQYGQIRGGQLVDIATVLTALTMTAIPCCLGFMSGYYYLGDL